MKRITAVSPLVPALLAAGLLALVGCASDYPAHPLSPQEMHPLTMSQTSMTLALDLPANTTALGADDAARFDRFVDDYLSIGTGPLEFIAGERESAASPRVRTLTERALRRGVSGTEIRLRLASLGAGSPQPLVLTYRRYLVELPKCGNWSDSASFNPANVNGANFGCAVQRDIGIMVANPADLLAAQPLSPVSATRNDRVINLYKQGKATESETSASNKASVSSVAPGAQ